jgi:hypothetical protein
MEMRVYLTCVMCLVRLVKSGPSRIEEDASRVLYSSRHDVLIALSASVSHTDRATPHPSSLLDPYLA